MNITLLNAEKTFYEMYGPHFTHREFECKCEACAKKRHQDMAPIDWFTSAEFKSFMEPLMSLRRNLAFPFQINSGYRCPAYNDSLYDGDGTHLNGPHTKGAADIGVSFERAYKLTALAMEWELGVGIHQRGDVAQRYIHLDNQGPRVWTY